MKISTKGRYALTIMIDIARSYKINEFVSLTDISKKENISLKYLEKIMINLKKADLFIVAKGKDVGYKLKRKPEDYSIECGFLFHITNGYLNPETGKWQKEI